LTATSIGTKIGVRKITARIGAEVTGGFAHRIASLSPGESKDILRLLQQYVTRPENVLRDSPVAQVQAA
jgi:hypothetical protein